MNQLFKVKEHISQAYILSSTADLTDLKVRDMMLLAETVTKANDELQDYLMINGYMEMRVKQKAKKVMFLEKKQIIKNFFLENYPLFIDKVRKSDTALKPRQCYYYLLSKHTGLSLKSIASTIELKQHHTTIIHAVKTVTDQIALRNKDYLEIIDEFDMLVQL